MLEYRKIQESEMIIDLFAKFNRYQDVKRCWRKENGEWVLKDIAFTEQWGEPQFKFLVQCLKNTLNTGGVVIGAFEDGKLIGFSSVENEFFGTNQEYLQLSTIHTSYESRGKGIGKKLFHLICKEAKEMGAEKLYISSHSSEETQLFYKAMGCVEACEYNVKLVAEEPCDCQLEFTL